MMIANDVMIQSLLPNSPKLCFLISKKAYINAKSLEKSLTQHNKKKGTTWEDVMTMSKIIVKEI
jgi:hypothetical protein